MDYFTQQELQQLNELTLAIHGASSLNALNNEVMRRLPSLIPHEKSFCTHHPTPSTPERATCQSLTMTAQELSDYTEHFSNLDYTAWYLRESNVSVYRDSDIVSEQLMSQSSIYKDWVLRMGMRYVCGNVIRRGSAISADFTLFRTEEHGDYTDHEMFLLKLVTDQIQLWFAKNYVPGRLEEAHENPNETFAALTPREREVARLACTEKSVREIAFQLSISYATARRHIANIYEKLGVNSRTELMAMLLPNHYDTTGRTESID